MSWILAFPCAMQVLLQQNYCCAAVALEKRRVVVTGNVVDGPDVHGVLDGLRAVSTLDLEERRNGGKEKRWQRGGELLFLRVGCIRTTPLGLELAHHWRMLRFTPILFSLTSFLGQATASHCPFGCDDLLHPHFSFGYANLYYTCVFLCFGCAYLCPAVLVAAYSFSSSYLLFCTLPQRGCTNYCI